MIKSITKQSNFIKVTFAFFVSIMLSFCSLKTTDPNASISQSAELVGEWKSPLPNGQPGYVYEYNFKANNYFELTRYFYTWNSRTQTHTLSSTVRFIDPTNRYELIDNYLHLYYPVKEFDLVSFAEIWCLIDRTTNTITLKNPTAEVYEGSSLSLFSTWTAQMHISRCYSRNEPATWQLYIGNNDSTYLSVKDDYKCSDTTRYADTSNYKIVSLSSDSIGLDKYLVKKYYKISNGRLFTHDGVSDAYLASIGYPVNLSKQ